MKKALQLAILTLLILFAGHSVADAQYVFERRAVDVSNLGISYTNIGAIGNPDISSQPDGTPSFQYPNGTGTEHLFEAGLWIGAQRDGQITVSTGSITNPSGYNRPGDRGYEMTNDGTPIMERSSLSDSDFFSPDAVSHQDYLAEFSDRRTVVSGNPITAHENPLYADIEMEAYNWNFPFADGISIVKYEITNNSDVHRDAGGVVWEDVYFGMYSDMVVRNVNTTEETGSAFFNKGGVGYIDSLYTLYAFDAGSNDFPRTDTYSGIMALGSEYRDTEFHPRYEDQVEDVNKNVPDVSPRFWKFGEGAGTFAAPENDEQRYNFMADEDWDYTEYEDQLREDGQVSDGNYIQLHRFGPFPEIEPGETVEVYFAFIAALKPDDYQGIIPAEVAEGEIDEIDNPEARQPLVRTAEWAYRLFEGQEDPETGERERFLVPEPPPVPNMRVELEEGAATVYWDDRAEDSVDPVTGEEDFEGYRLYRTKVGSDIEGDISSGRELLRQWDTPGTDVGYSTGFDEIRLDQPITFEDDNTEYHYAYEVDGMLSGWQYEFALTSFDSGGEGRESLESSLTANAVSVFPGARVNEEFDSGEEENEVKVYPNPYRVDAAWDGGTEFTRKINFTNLPQNAKIRIYTLAGNLVDEREHNAATYNGDITWYDELGSDNRIFSGGEHSWDLLSRANQNLATGLYLFSVEDLDSGHVQTGKFAIIK